MPKTEVWRALHGAAFFKGDCGKICMAVNEDIDPDNADALLWALAYRSNPKDDVQVVPHRGQGHGPKREHGGEEDSTLLMDLTMKSDMPPLASAEAAIHGKGQDDLGGIAASLAAAAAAVVRLFPWRLAEGMGRGCRTRRKR